MQRSSFIDSFVDWAESVEGLFTEVGRVIEPPVLVQSCNLLHFRLCQLEVKNVEVLLEPLGLGGLGDDGSAPLHAPSKHNLRRCLIVSSGDLLHAWLHNDALLESRPLHFDIRSGSQATERHDLESALKCIPEEVLLGQVWVHLDLQNSWLNLCIAHHLTEHGSSNVADSDILD